MEKTFFDDHAVICSEIYQVTGPVERFAGQIASHGYVVGEPRQPPHSSSSNTSVPNHATPVRSLPIVLP